MQLLLYAALAVVATAVVWKGSILLEATADHLAAYYRLPTIVQGAVIAAVGSSFPELSATVISTVRHGQFELGVAAIVGSAIFNILVIPGLSGLVGQRLSTDIRLVYKDAQFYLTSVAVLLLVFSFAVIYEPVAGETLVGNMNRPIALIPVLLYGLYLFIQQQDTADHRAQQTEKEESDVSPAREWMLLMASLALIVVGVEGLVQVALGLGEVLDTPSFLWGLTIIAVGTSLPDAFISIQAARQGRDVISVANVLGSNIFDLLLAVPLGVLIAGEAAVDFSVAAPMMGILTLATIVLFTMLRTQLALSRTESWSLLGLYGLFVIWMVLETFGVTRMVF